MEEAALNSTILASHLRALEQALLHPAVRRDPAQLHLLLAEEFLEFGSSGRVWTRAETIHLLAKEPAFDPPSVEDFQCSLLSPNTALVTYRAVRTDPATGQRVCTLRSSIWVQESGKWRVRFHQGTRTPSSPQP